LLESNDRKKMEEYAQLALDNCDSGHKDMWELATIAESNLYLGQLSMAETFYKKVAEVAGTDVRANKAYTVIAFYGYQSLWLQKIRTQNF